MNRRVADHKNRKNALAHEPETRTESIAAPTGRAARAVARVTARYAHAPSYSQMQAEEAHAAMCAAQAAQQAADDAHAAVQMMLAGLEAAAQPGHEPVLEPAFESHHEPAPTTVRHKKTAAAPAVTPDRVPAPTVFQPENDPFAGMCLAPLDPAPSARASAVHVETECDAAAQPIPANLIEFPREMVATRRMRPRRIEGPLAELESDPPQLSIFEVDPAAVSLQPASLAVSETGAPVWMMREAARPGSPAAVLEPPAQQEPVEEPTVAPIASMIVDLAPVNRRLLAILVDSALTLAAFAGLIRLVAPLAGFLHGSRFAEALAVFLLALACTGFQMLFASFTRVTPGMWYAGIGLCTLEGYIPERRQRWARLLALLLSVLPLGMGLAWSLFDEDRLTWHDRLSGTYLRLR